MQAFFLTDIFPQFAFRIYILFCDVLDVFFHCISADYSYGLPLEYVRCLLFLIINKAFLMFLLDFL